MSPQGGRSSSAVFSSFFLSPSPLTLTGVFHTPRTHLAARRGREGLEGRGGQKGGKEAGLISEAPLECEGTQMAPHEDSLAGQVARSFFRATTRLSENPEDILPQVRSPEVRLETT